MFENRLRDGGTVVPCSLRITGLSARQYAEHGGRHHYGDNVCVLPADDRAKGLARRRLRALIALMETNGRPLTDWQREYLRRGHGA